MSKNPKTGLFPALLKHWRRQRGLSQLDLAIAADVSNRHISFLETGRSEPSAEMVVRLGAALDVPLRHVNAMLKAVGHDAAYAEGDVALPSEVRHALELMKRHHDPFPLVVLDGAYNLLEMNMGAMRLFSTLIPSLPSAMSNGLNLALLTFDPNGAQPLIANFDELGRALLWRIQREALAEPENGPLQEVLERILLMPTVPNNWHEVDLTVTSSPAVGVRLRHADHELRFMTTVTTFQAPQSVALDELRIESWFPIDDETADMCRTNSG